MHELANYIPDPDALLALEPQELGATIIYLIRQRPTRESEMFHPGNMENELGERSGRESAYPSEKLAECSLALREAFAWLEAQGLIIPAESTNGRNGWRVLSRRARRFESVADVESYTMGSRLNRDLLHPSIAEEVWRSFIRGQYAQAVFTAMRAVEIAVRQASGFPENEHGVAMIRRAFHKDTGPLRDPEQDDAEREYLMHLFAGAVGSYKNPHSHRAVPMDDAVEAMEIVFLASHLLRIVDFRKAEVAN